MGTTIGHSRSETRTLDTFYTFEILEVRHDCIY